jgi:hypothetical protein
VVTGEDVDQTQNLIQTGGSTGTRVIDGPVWSSRVTSDALAGIATDRPIEVRNGPLVYRSSGGPACPISPSSIQARLRLSPATVFRPICVADPWTSQPSFDDPPLATGLLTPPLPGFEPKITGNCVELWPGYYASLPPLDISGVTYAYFHSGDYYFNLSDGNLGDVTETALLDFGGVQARAGALSGGITPSFSFPAGSPCDIAASNDAVAAASTGSYGATFYLGSQTHVLVDSTGALEILPRVQQGQDSTTLQPSVNRAMTVSIQAICTPNGSWCDGRDSSGVVPTLTKSALPGYVAESPGAARSLARTEGGGRLTLHGLLYAPEQQVRLRGAGPVRLLGGLITSRLDVQVDVGNLTIGRIANTPQPGPAEVIVIATATLDGASTSMRAVVDYYAWRDTDRVEVKSWRVCDASC